MEIGAKRRLERKARPRSGSPSLFVLLRTRMTICGTSIIIMISNTVAIIDCTTCRTIGIGIIEDVSNRVSVPRLSPSIAKS